MQLKDLREFMKKLPSNLDEYELVNGEVGLVDPEDTDTMVYRVDKPIIALYVDDSTGEICFFHQTQQNVNDLMKPEDNGTA